MLKDINFSGTVIEIKDIDKLNTYNILVDKKYVNEVTTPVKITLTIPQKLQKTGRTFEMIVVNKNGIPYVLKDEDNDATTITFMTSKFYAFTLCYKDQTVAGK